MLKRLCCGDTLSRVENKQFTRTEQVNVREVLTEVGKGRRNKEIADTLFISEKTVKNHISNIFAKLEVNSRAEAALLAARQGLV